MLIMLNDLNDSVDHVNPLVIPKALAFWIDGDLLGIWYLVKLLIIYNKLILSLQPQEAIRWSKIQTNQYIEQVTNLSGPKVKGLRTLSRFWHIGNYLKCLSFQYYGALIDLM